MATRRDFSEELLNSFAAITSVFENDECNAFRWPRFYVVDRYPRLTVEVATSRSAILDLLWSICNGIPEQDTCFQNGAFINSCMIDSECST